VELGRGRFAGSCEMAVAGQLVVEHQKELVNLCKCKELGWLDERGCGLGIVCDCDLGNNKASRNFFLK